MKYIEKSERKSLGAKTEDELMKYILEQPVEPGRRYPMSLSLRRSLA